MKTTVKKTVTDAIVGKKVYDALKNNEAARDNDSTLYLEVLKGYGCSPNMRATTLEKRVTEGVLPSRDTVTRYRRYLQMVDSTLRGTLWTKRQAWASVVRKSI